jgi:hypothetical protein
MKQRFFWAFLCILVASPLAAAFFADLEGGLASNLYNDIQIPGTASGTRFSLTDDFAVDNTLFWRARVGWQGEKHALWLLAAPLRFSAAGVAAADINYNGETFTAGTLLSGRYRFDSYRLSYRYELVAKGALRFGLGLTAKIRDASILIEGGGQRAEKSNTGFVPLFNFRLVWDFAGPFSLLFEGDALAAPQGRAEDVLLAVQYRLDDMLAFRLGYRIVEGGADGDEVYNFTLVQYLSAGAVFSF